jgi:hypothetical protein
VRRSCGSRKLQDRTVFLTAAGAAAAPAELKPKKFVAQKKKFSRQSVDGRPRISIIYKNDTAARQRLLDRLPVTGDILRGSLLQRTIRNHAKSCAKCASGEGHQLAVLTVSYAGGRTRQLSLRREQVGEVRRWLGNYKKMGAGP